MDELDKADWQEQIEGSSDMMLLNLAEYELRAAKNAVLEEDKEMHYEFANMVYVEMERRRLV